MASPLLIVIDLQNGWRHYAVEAAMLQSVKLCQSFPGDTIHCRFRNARASLFTTQLGWQRFFSAEDIAEIPEAATLNLPTYWRSTYSCLTDEVLTLARAHTPIFLAGVFTDISVAATAMALFDYNIPLYVVSDCVGTLHGEPVHHAALRSLEHAIGRSHVISSSEVADIIAEGSPQD